jgi:hypothetical protein
VLVFVRLRQLWFSRNYSDSLISYRCIWQGAFDLTHRGWLPTPAVASCSSATAT